MEEIIKELLEKGIIVQIGGKYIITEKYQELLAQSKATPALVAVPKKSFKEVASSIDVDLLMEGYSGDNWSSEIHEVRGRSRVTAFLDECEVPVYSKDKSYRLRGITKDVIATVDNIVDSPDIHPGTMIKAIKNYYKTIEFPRSVAKLFSEGEFFDLYTEYLNGDFITSTKGGTDDPKPNESWG